MIGEQFEFRIGEAGVLLNRTPHTIRSWSNLRDREVTPPPMVAGMRRGDSPNAPRYWKRWMLEWTPLWMRQFRFYPGSGLPADVDPVVAEARLRAQYYQGRRVAWETHAAELSDGDLAMVTLVRRRIELLLDCGKDRFEVVALSRDLAAETSLTQTTILYVVDQVFEKRGIVPLA